MGKGTRCKIILLSAMILSSLGIRAQIHDKEKYYQIRSMETGPWDFSPEFYYGILHSDYSGAEAYWSWKLSNFGLHYRFKESKSNVKSIAPRRLIEIERQTHISRHLQNEIDSLTPIFNEEALRGVERMVDIVFPQYKEDFETLGESITEGILYAMQKSNGKLKQACDRLQEEYDVVCSQIEYIHKTGNNHEVETTKRQLVYEDAKQKLTELAKASFKLAYYASTF